MRYLVTGAAGFIGSHLARRLLADGHEVLGVDCFTPYYDLALKEANAEGLDLERLDLAADAIAPLLAGCDGIFHLAGQPGVRSFGEAFADYARRNVVASQRLFEAAAAGGVRVVFSSSSSIYGDAERYPTPEDAVPEPISPYGITKLACEHLARAYATGFGLDVVVLRYFTVYGPRQRPDMAFARLVAALAQGTPFDLYGDGSQTRGFTYVDDVVAATAAAMERASAGAVLNVGGGAEASMREAVAALEGIAGRPLELRRRGAAAGDVARTAADTRRIEAALGWRAGTTLAEGLAAQWEHAVARVGAR